MGSHKNRIVLCERGEHTSFISVSNLDKQPQATEDDVIVQTHATALSPFDIMCLDGHLPQIYDLASNSYGVGSVVSGTVLSIGPSVTDVPIGSSVIGVVHPSTQAGTSAMADIVKLSRTCLILYPHHTVSPDVIQSSLPPLLHARAAALAAAALSYFPCIPHPSALSPIPRSSLAVWVTDTSCPLLPALLAARGLRVVAVTVDPQVAAALARDAHVSAVCDARAEDCVQRILEESAHIGAPIVICTAAPPSPKFPALDLTVPAPVLRSPRRRPGSGRLAAYAAQCGVQLSLTHTAETDSDSDDGLPPAAAESPSPRPVAPAAPSPSDGLDSDADEEQQTLAPGAGSQVAAPSSPPGKPRPRSPASSHDGPLWGEPRPLPALPQPAAPATLISMLAAGGTLSLSRAQALGGAEMQQLLLRGASVTLASPLAMLLGGSHLMHLLHDVAEMVESQSDLHSSSEDEAAQWLRGVGPVQDRVQVFRVEDVHQAVTAARQGGLVAVSFEDK